MIRPTVEAVDEHSTSGAVALWATQGTVQSGSFAIELAKHAPRVRLTQQACPLLVPLIEAGELEGPGLDHFIRAYWERTLRQDAGVDTLLLGCTHYPLIRRRIEALVAPGVKVLSQDELVAPRLADYLRRHPELDGPPRARRPLPLPDHRRERALRPSRGDLHGPPHRVGDRRAGALPRLERRRAAQARSAPILAMTSAVASSRCSLAARPPQAGGKATGSPKRTVTGLGRGTAMVPGVCPEGADDPDGHERHAGAQRQQRRPRLGRLQGAVVRAPALGEDPEHRARAQRRERPAQRAEVAGVVLDRDGAGADGDPAHERPPCWPRSTMKRTGRGQAMARTIGST